MAAPLAITDLSVSGSGYRHVELSWTVPADTSCGVAPSYYELRFSTYTPVITPADWNAFSSDSSYRLVWSTSGLVISQPQNVTVTGLANGKNYFFAIKSSTDGVNWSGQDSSSPEPFAAPFNTVPGNVSGHNLMYGQVVTTATPGLTWNVPSCGGTDANYGDVISSYTVELSTDVAFAIKNVKDAITANSWVTHSLAENTTWYWRVMGMDIEGLWSLSYLSQADRRFIVNAINDYPSSFSLSGPASGERVSTLTPGFTWAAATDTDPGDSLTYTLYYSTNAAFTYVATVVGDILTQDYAPVDPLIENATYYWKVYAVDSGGKWTCSLTTSVFSVNSMNEPPGGFSLSDPADAATVITSTPVLTWQPAVDPDPGDTLAYTLVYSSSDALLAAEYSAVTDIAAPTFHMPALQEDTSYWWQVHAIDSGMMSSQSSIRSFYVNNINLAPSSFSLISSSGIVLTARPPFDWADSSDADGDTFSYTLYYSTAADFSVTVATAGIAASSWSIGADLTENLTYYWKVTALDSQGHGTFSNETWQFTVNAVAENPAAFALVSPADGAEASFLLPSVDWQDTQDPDPADSVSYYTLYYSTSPVFTPETATGPIAVSSYTFAAALSNNTTYYWRVKAVSALSGETYSTESRRFIAVNGAPASFDLTASSGMVSTQTPRLSWQAALDPESDALTYTVYYSSYADFNAYGSSAGLVATEYLLPAHEDNSSWRWYARATDCWGNSALSGQTWLYTINYIPQPPDAFALLSPVAGARLKTNTPSLDWADTTDPDPSESVSYTVQYSSSPDFSVKVSSSGLGVSAYSITANLAAGVTWYWRVYATGSDSLARCAATNYFFISPDVRPMAPAGLIAEASADKTRATLSWQAVTSNEDGSALTNAAGYAIYRAYLLEDVFTVSASTAVAAGVLSWTDCDVYGRTIHYIARARNANGTESAASPVAKTGAEDSAVSYSADMSASVAVPLEIVYSSITISLERILGQQDAGVRAAYRLSATDAEGRALDVVFPVPVTISFAVSPAAVSAAPGSENLDCAVFWNNGVEWINLGGDPAGAEITVKTARLGDYQVRTALRAAGFNVLSAWPKIITPNGDGINDEFNYTFENTTASRAEGMIFGIGGERVASMASKTDSWLAWQGSDDNGSALPPGLYIYQVRCGASVYNGTVVIAR